MKYKKSKQISVSFSCFFKNLYLKFAIFYAIIKGSDFFVYHNYDKINQSIFHEEDKNG